MAEFLPLTAVAGGGGGLGTAIGDAFRAVARVVSGIIRTLGRAWDTVAKGFGKLVDWFTRTGTKLASLILRYYKIIAQYILVLLRYVARVMVNFYREFQKDPLTTLQFVGTMAILINSGL
ncbi:hypothetical protein SBFV2_gp51 [Sulfolobales Beppu filamentous virus 2]|uniref:Uncharacterized protein n=1 Tax=Sulfolobales Beppu filamentous virus 2 TaxID=2493123 RepID=A0A3Q8Q3R8_9VIRU|nr:hypothetical protein HOU84_gp51 [Sulfolobales Beppu filamentous virus 2]AZI75818.1 hypothetical protein SBFV2_gp51 [Sulfolobales Beppu filamentous virus 2]